MPSKGTRHLRAPTRSAGHLGSTRDTGGCGFTGRAAADDYDVIRARLEVSGGEAVGVYVDLGPGEGHVCELS